VGCSRTREHPTDSADATSWCHGCAASAIRNFSIPRPRAPGNRPRSVLTCAIFGRAVDRSCAPVRLRLGRTRCVHRRGSLAERVRALVSMTGYNLQNISVQGGPHRPSSSIGFGTNGTSIPSADGTASSATGATSVVCCGVYSLRTGASTTQPLRRQLQVSTIPISSR
jgi:hypothetical protein